ncbi:MAG: cyclase family protein [Acetobacteraceae bacterium]|nr:cyclase family protein [Acetobacteraceae bacterium]
MSENNWNRWGAEDERGALNHIDAEAVKRAAALVTSGQVVCLAQPLSARTPSPPHRAGMQHFMGRSGGDYAAGARRPGGFQFAEDTLLMPAHIGTHIDALCHAWYDDRLYNGFPGSGTRGTTGAARCGIDKMGPIAGRGILLDIATVRGGPLADGSAIGIADLVQAARLAGGEPVKGDVVLIRTGWAERAPATVSFDTEPGIELAAALWLAEREVAVVGADNFAVEVLPFAAGTVFPVHQRLIRDFGIPLLEGLVLKLLAETGRYTFMFAASPLPVLGGTGSPISPMAIL